jgi:ribA/ribD-fused uncharacterized protein
MKTIDYFDEEYAFLSNFYEAPVEKDGIVYPTNEHFFQAMKTLDNEERKKIAAALTPGQAKRMGRKVKLRPDWDSVRLQIMREGLVLKFLCHKDLAKKLVATGDAYLEEGNWWNDTFWGVCNNVGCNMLGKLLMQLREELRGNEN